MKITGYINLYRSGWFHRQGKPSAFDLHAGDVYPTLESAQRDIEPRTHYLATVPVRWQSDQDMAPNPADSVPVPLSVSRAAFQGTGTTASMRGNAAVTGLRGRDPHWRGLGKDGRGLAYRPPALRS
ncbi:hypothetical protein C7T35_23115 [Variovorax sp. WS11]|uniref:hypothetical protein n=1 Tax=Variovorax sp. WS11 TaxID=1105204 RepID=UPI000D0D47F5|nr:hypothetical protein [Variovorax sp. WS11]NDZ17557.1 hypothetical protein [Variovorax sp. WS11]PSL82237.1 hypothetical protein C7T35_23115 [Variovorax sp. WS11]